jgi:hypothetical protein
MHAHDYDGGRPPDRMTQQIVNVGSQPGDGNGDNGQTPFTKVNTNFTELYGTAFYFGVDSGVANAYLVAGASLKPNPFGPSLTLGTIIRFTPLNANTGAATFQFASAPPMAVLNTAGAALTGGEFSTTTPAVLQYNGTAWQFVNANTSALISVILTSAAVGAALYPRQSDEPSPSVVIVNPQYPAGDLRRYCVDLTGTIDVTAGFQSAAIMQAVAHRPVLVAGTFLYGATAATQIDMNGDWVGTGIANAVILINAAYIGECFRLKGNYEVRDIGFGAPGAPKVGTGINVAHDPLSSNTGYQRITRCQIEGFQYNIALGNVNTVTLDQVSSQLGAYGVYADPASGQQYNASVTLLNCIINANTQGINFDTAVDSFNVVIIGGALQDSTGSVPQASFTNVDNLTIIGLYGEGNPTQPWISSEASTLNAIGLINNGAGAVNLASGGGTQNNFIGYRTTNAAGVLTSGADTYVNLFGCFFPSSGNTYPTTTNIVNSTINAITPASGTILGGPLGLNGATGPADLGGWGVPTGAGVVTNFSGSAATLAQTSEAVAQIITTLKLLGLYGS